MRSDGTPTGRPSLVPRRPVVAVFTPDLESSAIIRVLLGSDYDVRELAPGSFPGADVSVALVDLDGCGAEQVTAVRRHGSLVIAYGTGANARVVAEAIRNGARAFISRPLDGPALRTKLRAVLGRRVA